MSALSLSRELLGWLRCAVFAAKREIIPTFKIESRAILSTWRTGTFRWRPASVGAHSRLLQFARFCHRKKFIEPVQPGKVVAFRAIEKTLLPHVNVEKSQQWAKRQVLRKGF